MAEPVLAVRGLSKAFGGLQAVSDVSFVVNRHEIYGVIGPNGAGKSTLFNLLAAAFPASGGVIEFDGRSTSGSSTHQLARRGLARTFQNLRLFGDQSVVDNVKIGSYRRASAGMLGGLFGGFTGRRHALAAEKERHDKALHWLDFVELAEHHDRTAEDLSFGQQRLLELARALALEPTLLLLDEPASGLNDRETERFARLLLGLPKLGITVLLVEHNMQLMMSVAERMMVLDCGRKIAEGTPASIQADPRVISVYLGNGDEQ